MIRFFRLLARVRYWKRRALNAEARQIALVVEHETELIKLREQMDAEIWRNRFREDTYASASILGAKGMFGLTPRSGPAATQKPQSLLDTVPSSVPSISGIDRMEFETEWWPYAQRKGFARQQAEKDFLVELSKRKALNDEPMM